MEVKEDGGKASPTRLTITLARRAELMAMAHYIASYVVKNTDAHERYLLSSMVGNLIPNEE